MTILDPLGAVNNTSKTNRRIAFFYTTNTWKSRKFFIFHLTTSKLIYNFLILVYIYMSEFKHVPTPTCQSSQKKQNMIKLSKTRISLKKISYKQLNFLDSLLLLLRLLVYLYDNMGSHHKYVPRDPSNKNGTCAHMVDLSAHLPSRNSPGICYTPLMPLIRPVRRYSPGDRIPPHVNS